jgi:hypothetical protein
MLQGLAEPVLRPQDRTKVVVRLGMIRSERNRLAELRCGIVEPALIREQGREVVPRPDVIGLYPNRRLVMRDGALDFPRSQ